MLGIQSGELWPGFSALAWAVGALCTGTATLNLVRSRISSLSPLGLFLALGYISILPWTAPQFPPNHVVRFADGSMVRLDGTVVDSPHRINDRLRFVLEVRQIRIGNEEKQAVGKVRVTSITPEEIFTGDRLLVHGRLRTIRNFNNPGGFDYRRYLSFHKIWAALFAAENRVHRIDVNQAPFISRRMAVTRCRLAKWIDSASKTETTGAVLRAMLLGDRSGIDPALRRLFSRTGTAHLLAISGLHIGTVAAFFFFIFHRLGAFFPPLLWAAWTKKAAALLTLLPVLAYGSLAGFSPSTQRAIIMVGVFLLSLLVNREQDLLNTLSVACLLILIIDPPALFSISFQLSFSAVASIILGFGNLRKDEPVDERKTRFLLKRVKSIFLASLFATLGTIPFQMLYFNQVSMVSLPVNLVAVPLVGLFVVPVGLSAVMVYLINAGLGGLLLSVSDLALGQLIRIVKTAGGPSWAATRTFSPNFLEIGLYCMICWGLLWVIGICREKTWRENLGAISGRKHRFALFLFLVVLLAGLGDVLYGFHERFWHRDLRVTVLDVGHGSSVLLEFPGGRSLLVDGGGFSDPRLFDIGERVVAPFLWKKKIMTVETLVLTHPNSDHMNGLHFIAENFNCQTFLSNDQSADTLGYRILKEILTEKMICAPAFKTLKRCIHFGEVKIRILYPIPDYSERIGKDSWRDVNANSLVLKIDYGTVSILLTGDITRHSESELVRLHGKDLKCTALLAPHHGSRHSNSLGFIDTVSPEVVIISARSFSHRQLPHPEVLKRYGKAGCQIYRTDQNGAIELRTDGRRLVIRPYIY